MTQPNTPPQPVASRIAVPSHAAGGPAPRQAIVVLHGMGQQRMMSMLRAFVEVAIPKPAKADDTWFYSRPDKVAESGRFDERRYLAPTVGERSQVELYEYNWAHLMEGNELKHMVPLAKRVMFRWPSNARIGRLWALLWVVSIVAVVGAVILGVATNRTFEGGDVGGVVTFVGATGVWGWLLTRALNFVVGFAVGTLADFARYTDAAPQNQEVRDVIRKGLVDLLSDLHNSTITTTDKNNNTVSYKRYDRIIVAAHSLGSLVAYDAMGLLWARMNKLHAQEDTTTPFDVKKLHDLEKAAIEVNLGKRSAAEYQEAQLKAWEEQRANGNPWRITDFITFGNPMAQGEQLMASKGDALAEQICRWEAPSCPPQPDNQAMTGPRRSQKGEPTRWPWCKKTAQEQAAAYGAGKWHYYWPCSAGAPILSHSSMFAVTRWTNIWYNADLFAGPLQGLFGKGIVDVEAKGDGFASRIPVAAHTKYLSYAAKSGTGATKALRDALALDAGGRLKDVPRLNVDTNSGNHTRG